MVRQPLTLTLLVLLQGTLSVYANSSLPTAIPSSSSEKSGKEDKDKKNHHAGGAMGPLFPPGGHGKGEEVILVGMLVACMHIGAGISLYNYLKHGSSARSFLRTCPPGTEYHLTIQAVSPGVTTYYFFCSKDATTSSFPDYLIQELTTLLKKDHPAASSIQLSLSPFITTVRKKHLHLASFSCTWDEKKLKKTFEDLFLVNGKTHLDDACDGIKLFSVAGGILGLGWLIWQACSHGIGR